MRHATVKLLATIVGVATLSFISGPLSFGAEDNQGNWIGTWAAGPTALSGAAQYSNQTLRLIVHTSAGGSQVRVRISNTFGTDPLVIGAAHVALRKKDARIVPNTDRTLTFSGRSSFTVPAGSSGAQ